jgi:magnesium chelatase family protein
VLFLDELPEFKRNVLECLRQPLEERKVTVARATGSITFPSAFMLVAAMNPCPCGRRGDPAAECLCGALQMERYRARISQPLLERLDLHIEIPAVKFSALRGSPSGEPSAVIRGRVSAARDRQRKRLSSLERVFCNAQIPVKATRSLCPLEPRAERLLERATERWKLSARVYHRILRIARTLADLVGRDRLNEDDLAEALQYRSLDRSESSPLLPNLNGGTR